jgi:hypothetical protein
MVIHLIYSWQRYLAIGWVGGVHVRYYLPLLPICALLAAAALEPLISTRVGLGLVLILTGGLLYSDCVVFLMQAASLTW